LGGGLVSLVRGTAGAPHAVRDEQWMERFRTLGDRLRIAPLEE
jgi:hypothetical protein